MGNGQGYPQAAPTVACNVRHMRLKNLPQQRYYLARPDGRDSGRVLVLVHGISRNAKMFIESIGSLVQGMGVTLVAPVFEKSRCKDYQRLGRNGHGPRSDLALEAILSEVNQLSGRSGGKAWFYGHSAGAQFVQRYLFAHPQRVERAALSAAGWYTFPHDLDYPFGICPTPDLPGIDFEPARFLRVPTAVFIGLEDTSRDEALNVSRRVDRAQGRTRLERARNWVSAMQTAARERALPTRTELFEVESMGHDHATAIEVAHLNQRVLQWLFPGCAA